jgi:hypothetical protein
MLFLIYGRNLKINFSQEKKRLYFDIKFAIQSKVHSKWIFKEIFWGYFLWCGGWNDFDLGGKLILVYVLLL